MRNGLVLDEPSGFALQNFQRFEVFECMSGMESPQSSFLKPPAFAVLGQQPTAFSNLEAMQRIVSEPTGKWKDVMGNFRVS